MFPACCLLPLAWFGAGTVASCACTIIHLLLRPDRPRSQIFPLGQSILGAGVVLRVDRHHTGEDAGVGAGNEHLGRDPGGVEGLMPPKNPDPAFLRAARSG